MKNKFLLILITIFISLMMVSCLVVTEKSYLDGITSVKTLSSGHEVDGVYYVFGGKLLKNSIIVNGYYSGSTGINIKDNAVIWAKKKGSSTEERVSDYLIINAGEEYTVWSAFNGRVSNTITVRGAAANQILVATSENNGIYLKGATIDDMGQIYAEYYDSTGALYWGNANPLRSDKFSVWQMSSREKEINELSTSNKNTLSEECKYLKVSIKGSDTFVLIPVTKIVDLETDKGWEAAIAGGFSSTGIKASTDTLCGNIFVRLYYGDVVLKNLSKKSDGTWSVVTVTRNEKTDKIESSKLNDGWKIEILKDADDTVKYTFDTAGEEVKINLPAGEYTIKVTCTKLENYGLPEKTVIVGKRDFTVSESTSGS